MAARRTEEEREATALKRSRAALEAEPATGGSKEPRNTAHLQWASKLAAAKRSAAANSTAAQQRSADGTFGAKKER